MASAWSVLALLIVSLTAVRVNAIYEFSVVHDRLVAEMDYGTPSAGKFLDARLTLNRQVDSQMITGRFSCRPRRGFGPRTGGCVVSRGEIVGTRAARPLDGGTPAYYEVTLRASGNGVACEFSGFAPRLQLGTGRLYTLDGSYRCVDAAGSTIQTGRFSAVPRRP